MFTCWVLSWVVYVDLMNLHRIVHCHIMKLAWQKMCSDLLFGIYITQLFIRKMLFMHYASNWNLNFLCWFCTDLYVMKFSWIKYSKSKFSKWRTVLKQHLFLFVQTVNGCSLQYSQYSTCNHWVQLTTEKQLMCSVHVIYIYQTIGIISLQWFFDHSSMSKYVFQTHWIKLNQSTLSTIQHSPSSVIVYIVFHHIRVQCMGNIFCLFKQE